MKINMINWQSHFLTDYWSIAELLTDNWQLGAPIQNLILVWKQARNAFRSLTTKII